MIFLPYGMWNPQFPEAPWSLAGDICLEHVPCGAKGGHYTICAPPLPPPPPPKTPPPPPRPRAIPRHPHPAPAHLGGGRHQLPLRRRAQRDAVAHPDPSLHPQGPRPRADLGDREQPELAGLMQMDVEPDAMPRRQAEDRI